MNKAKTIDLISSAGRFCKLILQEKAQTNTSKAPNREGRAGTTTETFRPLLQQCIQCEHHAYSPTAEKLRKSLTLIFQPPSLSRSSHSRLHNHLISGDVIPISNKAEFPEKEHTPEHPEQRSLNPLNSQSAARHHCALASPSIATNRFWFASHNSATAASGAAARPPSPGVRASSA